MSDHKTAEEIASLLCPRNSHGLVTCLDCLPIANALHSYLLQESKELVDLLRKINHDGIRRVDYGLIDVTLDAFQKKHGGDRV